MDRLKHGKRTLAESMDYKEGYAPERILREGYSKGGNVAHKKMSKRPCSSLKGVDRDFEATILKKSGGRASKKREHHDWGDIVGTAVQALPLAAMFLNKGGRVLPVSDRGEVKGAHNTRLTAKRGKRMHHMMGDTVATDGSLTAKRGGAVTSRKRSHRAVGDMIRSSFNSTFGLKKGGKALSTKKVRRSKHAAGAVAKLRLGQY